MFILLKFSDIYSGDVHKDSLCIISFSKYLLNTYYASHTISGIMDIAGDKTNKNLAFKELRKDDGK